MAKVVTNAMQGVTRRRFRCGLAPVATVFVSALALTAATATGQTQPESGAGVAVNGVNGERFLSLIEDVDLTRYTETDGATVSAQATTPSEAAETAPVQAAATAVAEADTTSTETEAPTTATTPVQSESVAGLATRLRAQVTAVLEPMGGIGPFLAVVVGLMGLAGLWFGPRRRGAAENPLVAVGDSETTAIAAGQAAQTAAAVPATAPRMEDEADDKIAEAALFGEAEQQASEPVPLGDKTEAEAPGAPITLDALFTGLDDKALERLRLLSNREIDTLFGEAAPSAVAANAAAGRYAHNRRLRQRAKVREQSQNKGPAALRPKTSETAHGNLQSRLEMLSKVRAHRNDGRV